ncbi:DBH-like monooxygenase protein 1 isoform X2 [Macrobrachium nipponense]|uniref:DBH-like monooxygenase protein 1 isoform X2 n=1 Tax=Macrobrachium nipponense TaxID=159736 RepID=UPI0030C8C8A5
MWCSRFLAAILLLPLSKGLFTNTAEGDLGVMKFQHQAILDQTGAFVMLWSPLEDEIHIEIQVETTGFIGIGFSPSGGMKGADIVLAWVDDFTGELHVHDRHATGMMIPFIDKQQDITVAGGYQNDTHTVLRFSRPWNTCDDPEDMKLSGDTTRVIWAYSYRDPEGDMDMGIHDQRGTKSIYLREPRFSLPTFSEDVKSIDFLTEEVKLPDHLDTIYWCQIYRIPGLVTKNHLIGYTPVIQNGNHEQVHHILLYECHVNESSVHYEQWLIAGGRQCLTANMPTSWYYCSHTIIAWAIGSEGELFPEHVGLPLGEAYGGADYYMMQIHYDNPKLKTGVVDSSGLRLYYTDQTRELDGGVIMLGSDVEPTMIIPPRQHWRTTGICSGDCTQSFPKDGIRIFQGLLHAHLLGRAIAVRHIRNGVELPTVFKDMNYDFNYQQQRVLKEEMVVMPGDTLIVECDYDSTRKAIPTFGGEDTDDEMCLAYFTYYPRMQISRCLSVPTVSQIYKPLGVQKVYFEDKSSGKTFPLTDGYTGMDTNRIKEMDKKFLENPSGDFQELDISLALKRIVAKSPKEYENRTLYDMLHDSRTWQDPKVLAELQDLTNYGTHKSICGRVNHTRIQRAAATVRYPDFIAFKPLEDEACSPSHSEVYVPYESETTDINNEDQRTSEGKAVNKKEKGSSPAEGHGSHASAAACVTVSLYPLFLFCVSVWRTFIY